MDIDIAIKRLVFGGVLLSPSEVEAVLDRGEELLQAVPPLIEHRVITWPEAWSGPAKQILESAARVSVEKLAPLCNHGNASVREWAILATRKKTPDSDDNVVVA